MTSIWPAWSPLLPVAMIGTDRHAAPLPTWPGEIGVAIAALADARRPDGVSPDIDQAAADVLRTAGILTVCGLAGSRPLARESGAGAPAGADAQPVADDPAIATAFAWVLRDGPERLRQAFFLRFAQAGLRLPHAALPAALELARQSLALRATIQPLLGERGVWLARQRDDWQFGAGVVAADELDARQWSEGTLEQRKAFFARERATDPGAARDRLLAVLPELPAKERAELARGLAVSLGPADEALVDKLRADRSQDVRDVALALILRLPDAAHPRRAIERVAALMARGTLLTGRRWTITAPAEAASDWKADQVDPDVANGIMGQRAWWLYQLVRQVPLGWWTTQTGLDIKPLMAWADASEWAVAIWRGWRDVLRRAPDRAWAEALLENARGAENHRGAGALPGDRDLFLGMTSPEARERILQRELEAPDVLLATQIRAIVGACAPGEAISPRLSALLVARVRNALAKDTAADPGLHNANVHAQDGVGRCLPDLCCTLPLSFLADFNDWPASTVESAAVGRARHEGRQIIQARRALDAHLP